MKHAIPSDGGGAVYPGEGEDAAGGIILYDGITLRQDAAIRLRIPNSGLDWLDEMIRESLRNKFAGQALAGLGDVTDYASAEDVANDARITADAVMAEMERARDEDTGQG